MTSGGNSLTAAVLLIIMMKVFSVLTLCPSEMYQAQKICCPKCPAGSRVKTDCTETANTSCVACENGTHMDKPNGLKQCTHCTACDRNFNLKKKRPCTTTSDAICEPRDGFYCVHYEDVHCTTADKHKRCNPGEYISQAGTASSNTECSQCGSGTFSDGTLTFCRPHRPCDLLNLELIKPGNATTDAQCEEQDDDVLSWIVTGCLLLILVILILIALCLFRKKIGCLKRGEEIIVHLINLKKNEEKETEIELRTLNETPV